MGCIWEARGTYLADIQSQLLPQIHFLQREEKTSQLDIFFPPKVDDKSKEVDDKSKHVDPDNWRTSFLSVTWQHPDLLYSMMNAKATNKKLPLSEDLLGWMMLNSTSFKWDIVDPKSRRQVWPLLTKMATIEEQRFEQFIKPMLKSTHVVSLRKLLSEALKPYVTPYMVKGKSSYNWVWYDGLTVTRNTPKSPKTSFKVRMAAADEALQQTQYNAQISRISSLVQKLPVSTFNGDAGGALEFHVGWALKGLLIVLSLCFHS